MELRTEETKNTLAGKPEIQESQGVPGGSAYGQQAWANSAAYSSQPRMTRKEFYKQASMHGIRSNILTCGIFCYISAALTFVWSVLIAQNIFGIVDVLFVLGMGLGIHIGKSRACAIILLVYAVLNCIYMLVTTGHLGGYLIAICAGYAVASTCTFQKAWKEYSRTGVF